MANAIPTLLAYSAPMSLTRKGPFKHLAASSLVPSEFCGRLHTHGTAEGARVPHCPSDDGPHELEFGVRKRPSMYTLKYAGEAPQEIIDRLTKKRKPSTCSH